MSSYSAEDFVGFGISLSSSMVAICGCFSVFYIVKRFQSLVSYSLFLMNFFFWLHCLLSAFTFLDFGEAVPVLVFFSFVFLVLGVGFYWLQIMYRLWMMPFQKEPYYQIANIAQWVCFTIMLTLNIVNTICFIPTDLQTFSFLSCSAYSNQIMSTVFILGTLFDIANSVYVITIVTIRKASLSGDDHFSFVKRRVPILLINIALSIIGAVFMLVQFQNHVEVLDLVTSFTIFASAYYFQDWKDFVLKTADMNSHSSGHNKELSKRPKSIDSMELQKPPEIAVLSMQASGDEPAADFEKKYPDLFQGETPVHERV